MTDQTVVELQVQFPAGFEPGTEDGEFDLRNVQPAYPHKPVGDVTIPK